MFNSPRDTNFNPNDDTSSKKQEWARYAAWTILAHPTTIVLLLLVVVADVKVGLPFELVAIAFVTTPAVECVLLRRQHGPRRLVMWANVIRFRRRWFTVWTATVKARDDHTTQVFGLLPVLGVLPRFKGTIGYFTVRPPAGHTLEYVAELSNVLAAHSPGVVTIEIIYNRPTDSTGTLQAVFDQTTTTINPTWASPSTSSPTTPTRQSATPTKSAFPQNPTTSTTTPKDHINEPV